MSEFLELIKNGESEVVEFKQSTAVMRSIVESICAFANTNGGSVCVGISDKGEIVGQNISDDTLKNIANEIKLNTDPKLFPSIQKINIEKKNCILITIESSPLRPHSAFGISYVRVGATNQKLDRDSYEILLQQRWNGYNFDYQPVRNATINDIDADSVCEFVETSNIARNTNINLLLSVEIILENLELLKNNELTCAAILLFGKQPSRFFSSHFETKCDSLNFVKKSSRKTKNKRIV